MTDAWPVPISDDGGDDGAGDSDDVDDHDT